MKDISCKSGHTHSRAQRQAGIAIRMMIGMLDREILKEAVEIPLIEAAPDQRKVLESNRMKQRGRKCLN